MRRGAETGAAMTGGSGPRAGRREWTGLALIAFPSVLHSMDPTALNLAVPVLSAELGPTSSRLPWIMDVYGFLLAGFLLAVGTPGGRIGRRRLLLICAVSVHAAFSTSGCRHQEERPRGLGDAARRSDDRVKGVVGP